MFEYDNFCNFILKYKLWLKKTTYIFISSLNLVTAHNFAVKIGLASSTISGNKRIVYNDERFITREETAKLLHVDFSTLWRWNKLDILRPNKVGPRRVMYKYSDVLRKLNGEGQQKEEKKEEEEQKQKGEGNEERC